MKIYLLTILILISCNSTKVLNNEVNCLTIELYNTSDVIVLGHQYSEQSMDMFNLYVIFLIDSVYKGPQSLKTAVKNRRNTVFERIEGLVYAEPVYGNKEHIYYYQYRNDADNNTVEIINKRHKSKQKILFFNYYNQDSVNWYSSLELKKSCRANIKIKRDLLNFSSDIK